MTIDRLQARPPVPVPCVGGCVRADAAAPTTVRRALKAFLDRHGVDDGLTDAVMLVATEAVSNAVLHAYGDATGHVEYAADIADGDVQLVVADTGLGLRTGHVSAGAGLGLKIIAGHCDDFQLLERPRGGLELWMRFVAAAA
jgi:anti-sigma regulatory factor (Ser/Thr protein kinase)